VWKYDCYKSPLDYISTGNIKHFTRIDGLYVENWTLL